MLSHYLSILIFHQNRMNLSKFQESQTYLQALFLWWRIWEICMGIPYIIITNKCLEILKSIVFLNKVGGIFIIN